MAVIKIKTPSGIQEVRIKGDSPDEQETAAIINTFFPQAAKNVAQTTDEKTIEEQQKENQLPVRDIDYDTGVQDMGFRVEFSKGDNDKEKFARLESLGVNRDAIQIDPNGEFLIDRDKISEEVKNKYGITGTGLLAIDEKK